MEQSRKKKKRRLNGSEENDEAEDEECELEVWETLSKSFRQVQTVLDQNRLLIQQVNDNHQSKIPDNLAKNVSLICEINGNISKVLSIYSDLSLNFTNIVHQHRAVVAATAARNRSNSSSDGNKVDSTESLKHSIQQ